MTQPITHPNRASRTEKLTGSPPRRTALTAVAGVALLLAGCTLGGGSGDPTQAEGENGQTTPEGTQETTVRVVTHDSFWLPEELLETFETQTGYSLEFSAPGDAGALVNQLILTKDSPLGDVVYGVDNAFASRGIGEGVFEEYTSAALPGSAQLYLIDGGNALTPIDIGDVCLNIDTVWFAQNDIPEPAGLADLTGPDYADLTVVTNPATSSPGLGFLLATVAEFGDEWTGYWEDLNDNGLLVVDSWSTAYRTEFSGSDGDGERPVVLSYASSPAAEVDDGESPTAALLTSCFRQVEYAGVLAGAANPSGAQAFIDFLLSDEVQAALPENMFVYPVNDAIELPEDFVQWGAPAPAPYTLDPEQIDASREDWIAQWTETVIG